MKLLFKIYVLGRTEPYIFTHEEYNKKVTIGTGGVYVSTMITFDQEKDGKKTTILSTAFTVQTEEVSDNDYQDILDAYRAKKIGM